MNSSKNFLTYHPIVLFVFFISTIFICMLSQNPVIIGICFLSGAILYGVLSGIKRFAKSLVISIIIIALVAALNPLFARDGMTILFYIGDNPVTKESIYYGAMTATMLVGVFYWFRCYDLVVSSDQITYLFGRILPKFSLILCMVLGLVPRLKQKYRQISEAQRGMGMYSGKGFFAKLNQRLKVYSALVTLALENSIETADSMRSRGYGIKGRTACNNYYWSIKDSIMICIILALTAFLCGYIFFGQAEFAFYPTISSIKVDILAICFYGLLTLFMSILFFSELAGRAKWQYLKSKI